MKRFRVLILSALALTLLSSKCGDERIEPSVDFDKNVMLKSYGEKVILPSLTDLQTELNELKSSFDLFETNLNISNLEALQTAWKDAYIQFQAVQMFNFGPSMDFGIKGAFATYPTDTAKINNNILAGNYYLGIADNADAIGFPAMDYLLFDVSTQAAFGKISNDNNRLIYIGELITKMNSEIEGVVASWEGNYFEEFIANNGTSSTSSLSFLVNEYNKDYELTKLAKLGIPIGEKSLGIAQPEFIEAPYSAISFELIKESMLYLEDVYKGDYMGEDGVGFQDYILSFKDQGSSLNQKITSTFEDIHTEIAKYDGSSLKYEIEQSNDDLGYLYDLIQSQMVNIKTDMPALFSVMITYQDNDGD